MRVSVLQENLVKGLDIVAGAVGSRPTLPVLSNVLLTPVDGRLKLVSTDLELSISVWVGARVEQEGAITVPFKQFNEIAKNLSPERIDFELNVRNQTLHTSCGGTTVQFKGINADEFPLIPPVVGTNLTLDGDTLKDMIGEVVVTAAKEDNRPVLTGVYTHFEGNVITMASADGYRLTVRTAELDYEVAEPLTMIIPARTMQTLAKVIGKATVTTGKGKKKHTQPVGLVNINVDIATHRVMFDFGDIQIVSQLIEGTFPKYERIYPRNLDTRTIVYRDEFLRACKRAKVFAKDSSNTARITIQPSADCRLGTLRVFAQSSEMGEIDGMIDASIEGNAIVTHFNVEYLIDFCGFVADDQLLIETATFADPAVIRGLGRTDFYYVLMPMQIGQ